MPFPTNPALEKAVIADAENDLPRLVYADWLDENGDSARAAFIRTQIALHNKSPADVDFTDLELTRDELVVRLAGREDMCPPPIDGLEFPWHFGFDMLMTGGYFERGFPAVASVADYEVPVESIRRMFTVTTMRGLSSSNDVMSTTLLLLSAPETAALATLAVEFFSPDSAAIMSGLRSSPAVKGLRQLSVRQPYASEGAVRTLAGVPFRKLHRLELPLGTSSRAEIGVFLKAEWVRRLRDVRLTASPGPSVEPLLKGLAGLPHLHTLGVTGCRHFSLAALKKKHGFPSLGKLELRQANLRGDQADALAACDFPKLAVLGLDGTVPSSAVQKLVAADWFPGLRSLWINSPQLNDGGAQVLRAANGLKSLALFDPILSRGACEVLPVAFPHLQSLTMHARMDSGEPLTTAQRFAARLASPHLRNLSIEGLRWDMAGVAALASNATLGQLTRLNLRNAAFTNAAVETLVTSPHLQRLLHLNLRNWKGLWSSAEADGLTPLLDPAVMPNLVECGVPDGLSHKLRKKLEAARPGLRLV